MIEYQLRDYQIKGKKQILSAFNSGKKHVIFCQPTGSGKTVTFADIAKNAVEKGTRVMICCDRKELISQAHEKLMSLGLWPVIIAPGYPMRKHNLYLASVDTLKRRDLPEIDLLIIDEGHKQTFDNLILKYTDLCDPYIIGATATPHRSGPQKSLHFVYDEIIETISIQELIQAGHLVPAKTFGPDEDFSTVKKRGSEFDVRELYKKFDQNRLYSGVVENYKRFAEGKKAICFNVSVEHSMKMCRIFNDNGISAEHVDGNTSKNRRNHILKAFARGDFKVLCNCGVLTTGYDEPSIEVVIINRATMSLPLWLQMCGRGSRPFEEKENFTIIDQGANWKRHGLWHFEREWNLHKPIKRNKSDGVKPVKMCEKCDAINHVSAQSCVNCGKPFGKKEKQLKTANFVEIKEDRLKRGIIKKPNPKTCSRSELHEYANRMGYKSGWAHMQLKKHGRA